MDISNNETDLFAADLSTDTPTHDVHGKDKGEAIDELKHFLAREASLGSDAVRIIHGRGEGILRAAVHDHLKREISHGRIIAFRDSEHPGQAGGVTIALLDKKGATRAA